MASIQVSEDAQLYCPGCGSVNLHHELVTVFNRREDQSAVVVTTISPAGYEEPSITTVMTTAGYGNPSARRHGLRIRFTCEQCPGVFDLTLAQHKGTTFLTWDDPIDAK
jgi:hypothetical protein